MNRYLTLFLFLSFHGIAQENDITIFSGDEDEQERIYVPSVNAIKIAPLNFIGGTLPIYYERAFSNFSFQIGAGPTFKRFVDFFDPQAERSYDGNIRSDGELDENIAIYSFSIDNTEAKLGYYYSLEPKYYYSEDGFDGNFVGIKFSEFNYNSNVDGFGSGNELSQSGKDKFRTLAVVFGTQTLGDAFASSYFVGTGVNWAYRETYGYDHISGPQLIDGSIIYDKVNLHFEVGFRIGLHFK